MIAVNLYAKGLRSTGISCVWIGLQAPKIGNLGENLSKVSGLPREYSRFWETFSGDFFDRHCVVGLAVIFASLHRLKKRRIPERKSRTDQRSRRETVRLELLKSLNHIKSRLCRPSDS